MAQREARAGPRTDRRVGRDLRLFAAAVDEPRSRRASDVVVAATSAAALLTASILAEPQPAFARSLTDIVRSASALLDGLWQVLADATPVLAVALLVAAGVRRRWAVGRDVLLAAALAAVASMLLARSVQGSWPDVWEGVGSALPPPRYAAPRLAVPAAAILTAAPHLTLPARRWSRWVVGAGALAVIALGATTPLGAVAALLVAVFAAAVVHLTLGSSGGRPGLDLVRRSLAELGVSTTHLEIADRQEAGPVLVHAVDGGGEPLIVRVYGRDAHDAAVLSTLWRRVWFRSAGSPIRLGRIQQVEYEAFLTLFARQAGVLTDTVVTAGETAADDALLVVRRIAVPLTELTDAQLDGALVNRCWHMLARLHRAGIAHGRLDERHVVVDDAEVGVIDFRGASLTTDEARVRIDEAQLFVTTVGLVGTERAIRAALGALGPDGMKAMLPYLQQAVLTSHQRRGGGSIDVDELRADAGRVIDTPAPELQRIQRVSAAGVIRVALPAVAVIALLSALAGMDFSELGDVILTAAWGSVLIGFLVAQLPRLTQAVSTIGASPVPLPLGPVYALQLAISYANLAVPTSAARIAINIRFFQRHGVPPASAMAAGALDGLGGMVVQAALLIGLLLLTSVSLDLELDGAVDDAVSLLWVAALIAVGSVVVVAVVPRLRRFVVGWGRRLGTEGLATARGLRSPRRLGLLLGGNLATEILFALALVVFVQAFGYSVGIAEMLVINIGVSLLAGLLPIPGGIGVAEGGLTYGLVQAGVPEESAFAAVLLYRMATFYLPPIWGYLSMNWLERRRHL